MNSKTRKRIWPVSLVMALAVVGLMAFVALSTNTGEAQAQGLCDTASGATLQALIDAGVCQSSDPPPISQAGLCDTATGATLQALIDAGVCSADGDGGDGTPGATGDGIVSSSTTGGAGVELILTIAKLPMDAVAGSSVEVYLEDDFQVPDSIDRGNVYFTVPGGGVNQNGGGRVYSADPVEIDDDDHFGGDDDWSIRVFIPDMNNAENSGYNGPTRNQTLKLVFPKAAGIKNPTEQGTHSVGYSVLGPNDEANDGPMVELDDVAMSGAPLETKAKISLSDEDAGRGKEITVTGTGFNNGTGAEVYVYVSETEPACQMVIENGTSLGSAEVGSDDKFAVTFTAHQDDLDPGKVNWICAVDSEAGNPRMASAVKVFDLEASIALDPASGTYGDEITLKARDFTGDLSEISIGPNYTWTNDDDDSNDAFEVEIDGTEYVFEIPGDLGSSVQVAAKGPDGSPRKTATLEVTPAGLELSATEVVPNETIIISGSGFREGSWIYTDNITIDGETLVVSEAGVHIRPNVDPHIDVTSSGDFTATIRVWADGDNNPALDDDEYTIEVIACRAGDEPDNAPATGPCPVNGELVDFEAEATVTIKAPTVEVSPGIASPRDFIVITGSNWPASNSDSDHEVEITVDDKDRTVDVDRKGNFRYEYQLSGDIGLGEDHDVVVLFEDDGGDIEEEATFAVPSANVTITPEAAAPGQSVEIMVMGMPIYERVSEVDIDGGNRLTGTAINTDREGNATISNIFVPFADPGFYPVRITVGDEVAVVQLEILPEDAVAGVAAMLPDAVSDLGDNLEAIFHFNNTSKAWTFYDPRPEFADLNTLNELHSGQPYWVLVKDSQEDVDWNGRLVNFTCAGGDCWNLEIW